MRWISTLAISGQPLFSNVPLTVGQRSSLSETPSPSVSGQPLKANVPANSGQRSSSFTIPSLSLSNVHIIKKESWVLKVGKLKMQKEITFLQEALIINYFPAS